MFGKKQRRSAPPNYPANPFAHPLVFYASWAGVAILNAGYYWLPRFVDVDIPPWVFWVVTAGWPWMTVWSVVRVLNRNHRIEKRQLDDERRRP